MGRLISSFTRNALKGHLPLTSTWIVLFVPASGGLSPSMMLPPCSGSRGTSTDVVHLEAVWNTLGTGLDWLVCNSRSLHQEPAAGLLKRPQLFLDHHRLLLFGWVQVRQPHIVHFHHGAGKYWTRDHRGMKFRSGRSSGSYSRWGGPCEGPFQCSPGISRAVVRMARDYHRFFLEGWGYFDEGVFIRVDGASGYQDLLGFFPRHGILSEGIGSEGLGVVVLT